MPHSAFQAGQHSRWRSGKWSARSGKRTLSVDFGCKRAWDLEKLEPNTFFPVPASVVFARNMGFAGGGVPLAGEVERWLGAPGENADRQTRAAITDTSAGGDSPYAGWSRLGAILYPRCLVFVEETTNPAIIRAGQTVTVNPRRGTQDKQPWRNLDLTAITGQTIETQHVFDVYLGETVIPYETLQPLRAVLPLKHGDVEIPLDPTGTGGIPVGGLLQRMRQRWRTVSRLWEENKSTVNKLNMIGQLNFWGHL